MVGSETSGALSGIDTSNSNPPEVDFTNLPTRKLMTTKDLPRSRESKPWHQVELPVDALLLTEKDCELLSFVSFLIPSFYRSYSENLGIVFFGKLGERGNTRNIAIMKLHGGPIDIITLKDAAVALRPKAVYSVGVCGGLNNPKVKLGDVVIPSKLRTYSYVELTESGVEGRGVAIPLHTRLSKSLKSAVNNWKPPLKDEGEVNVITDGAILCGPEVVGGKDGGAKLSKRFLDAIAIEMEGQGEFICGSN